MSQYYNWKNGIQIVKVRKSAKGLLPDYHFGRKVWRDLDCHQQHIHYSLSSVCPLPMLSSLTKADTISPHVIIEIWRIHLIFLLIFGIHGCVVAVGIRLSVLQSSFSLDTLLSSRSVVQYSRNNSCTFARPDPLVLSQVKQVKQFYFPRQ